MNKVIKISHRIFILRIASCTMSYDKYVDKEQTNAALSMLLRDRSHEFKDLANALNISTSSANWEKSVLQFCLDFNDCFKIFTEKKEPDERIDSDHQKIHKCMILMRQIAKGKMSMIEITNLQNIADMLAKEFKLIYKNI